MKLAFFLMCCLSSVSLGQLLCSRGDAKLFANENVHLGGGPNFYNVKINDEYEGAHKVFIRILEDSQTCSRLDLYIDTGDAQIYLCHGEMFAPYAVYGQIIMSKGAVESFIENIAPVSGWDCEYRQFE